MCACVNVLEKILPSLSTLGSDAAVLLCLVKLSV